MNLSKTRYCNAIQCKKMLWLLINKPEEKEKIDNDSVLENGTNVGELAKKLLGDSKDVIFNENLEEMIKQTNKFIEDEEVVITEASFKYENNFCSVDLLKKNKDEYEIYEVKSSTEIHDVYKDDVSYQYYVLKHLGLNVVRCYIVHLNANYERIGELDIHKLFTIEDVTDIANEKYLEIEKNIKNINEYMKQINEPRDDIGIHCIKPYPCPYFKYCTKHLPEKNIFNVKILNNTKKFDYYHQGIYSYEDLLKQDINWKFKQQIEFELYNKEDYINKDKISEFVNTITYPLYFLDFETYQQPVPQFDYVKPFMQIPFQYSLHYLEAENATLKHKEFLAEPNIDPRRSLAEQLVKDIPVDVCTVAYNMMFEKMVIKNLAKLYPDLSKHLMNIYDNMKDLMVPFKNHDYYSKEMYGSYSIKYVLPALFPNDESLNYHNLEQIHNGSEAMNTYASMGLLSKEEQERTRKNLLEYCKLDTYAMVKIWDKLKIYKD